MRAVPAWRADPDVPDHQGDSLALALAQDAEQAVAALAAVPTRCPRTAERAQRMLWWLYTDGFAGLGKGACGGPIRFDELVLMGSSVIAASAWSIGIFPRRSVRLGSGERDRAGLVPVASPSRCYHPGDDQSERMSGSVGLT